MTNSFLSIFEETERYKKKQKETLRNKERKKKKQKRNKKKQTESKRNKKKQKTQKKTKRNGNMRQIMIILVRPISVLLGGQH